MLLGFHFDNLVLEVIDATRERHTPLHQRLVLVSKVSLHLLQQTNRFNFQLLYTLRIVELLAVLDHWFQAKLHVEKEFGNHWWHVVELVHFVLEVFVDKRILNLLVFPLG